VTTYSYRDTRHMGLGVELLYIAPLPARGADVVWRVEHSRGCTRATHLRHTITPRYQHCVVKVVEGPRLPSITSPPPAESGNT